MDNANQKFEKIVSRLQADVPQLKDPNALTESIMKRIEQNSSTKIPAYLLWIRTLSGVAAIFLIGLFIFEQNNIKTIDSNAAMNTSIREIPVESHSSPCQIENGNLLKAYLCHQQQNSIANKRYKNTHSVN